MVLPFLLAPESIAQSWETRKGTLPKKASLPRCNDAESTFLDRNQQTCRVFPNPAGLARALPMLLWQPALHLRRQPGEKGVGAARLHQHGAGAGQVHDEALAAEQRGL